MASIVKRKSKYSVVYTCVDEKGVKRQKWETFTTNAEAKKRKAEIEFQQDKGEFIVPSANTIKDLLNEYVSIYGVNTWALSTYEARRAMMDNYILPIIGDMKLDDISPRMMDQYYVKLLTVKSSTRPYCQPKNEFLSARTVREIHKLLRCAFNQAVKWELMQRNPVLNATLPKAETTTREIWDADTLLKAFSVCDDDILRLALILAFSCSLRMGEMLGLTWDCIDVTDNSIKNESSNVYVNKELQRVSRSAMVDLSNRDVVKQFPSILGSQSTCLVLKAPKTKSSVRRIYLPPTVAYLLQERKQDIENLKELLGDEYKDYNLVFCNNSGSPIEGQIINRALNKLIEENNLPKVVFHSLRHSSITYKLKLNGGDIKSVQGDSGHAQASMVTERYSHIIDEDRRFNAQRFEHAFFSGVELRNSKRPSFDSDEINSLNAAESAKIKENQPVQTAGVDSQNDLQQILALLQNKPELLTTLKTLASAL
ncbi:MAG: site-specific integrase [Clostridia bacterium]|nr:site-specific integrase [Clostridia bacterium]